ncbi:MAG TPA: Crp/Fnr family transcriptional regulator [Polyangia bacterium]|nr:Crp/Fnr family transcriptional regulator [Polyangia bacterium]
MGDPLFTKYGKTQKAGDVLFTAGEQGQEMYVIRSGSVRIAVHSRGVEKTLAVLGPGEFVGEMSILTDQPRSATATVQDDAELLVVGVRVLEEMIVHNTEIALRLVRKLARRLESADALIRVLLHRDPKERVIDNLKRMAQLHSGAGPDRDVRIEADCAAFAEQVGLDQAEVEDVMSRLVGAGFIRLEDGSWVIGKIDDIDDFLGFLRLKEQYR